MLCKVVRGCWWEAVGEELWKDAGKKLPVTNSYWKAAAIGQPLRGAAVEAVGKELLESCCEELLLRSCC